MIDTNHRFLITLHFIGISMYPEKRVGDVYFSKRQLLLVSRPHGSSKPWSVKYELFCEEQEVIPVK